MTEIPIIVTRAEPGASETIARLRGMGRTVISSPILSLHERSDVPIAPTSDLSGLVFTSANGVRVFAAREQDRSLTAWCVGPATAEAAQVAGFQTVMESAGNAEDLANYIAEHSAPDEKPLLHVANTAATGTLKSTLEMHGFTVEFAGLYEMRPATELPSDVQDLVHRKAPAILLIHSNKGATAFANLLPSQTYETWIGVGISKQATGPLQSLQLQATFLAEIPNEDGLLSALHEAIATLSA